MRQRSGRLTRWPSSAPRRRCDSRIRSCSDCVRRCGPGRSCARSVSRCRGSRRYRPRPPTHHLPRCRRRRPGRHGSRCAGRSHVATAHAPRSLRMPWRSLGVGKAAPNWRQLTSGRSTGTAGRLVAACARTAGQHSTISKLRMVCAVASTRHVSRGDLPVAQSTEVSMYRLLYCVARRGTAWHVTRHTSRRPTRYADCDCSGL